MSAEVHFVACAQSGLLAHRDSRTPFFLVLLQCGVNIAGDIYLVCAPLIACFGLHGAQIDVKQAYHNETGASRTLPRRDLRAESP